MPRWERREIDAAFRHLLEVTDSAFITGDFSALAACYTEDALYSDLGDGFAGGWETEIRGRAAIRQSIESRRAAGVQAAMCYFPVPWYSIDVERGWVVCGWRNRLRDPGNGTVLEETSYSRLGYAGNGQWDFREDICNPVRMRTLIEIWRHERARCEAAGLAMPAPTVEQARRNHAEVWETDRNPGWSRAEIEDTARRFEDAGNRAFRGQDHAEWLQFYTPDVHYRELGFGFYGGWEHDIHGRERVKAWIDPHCSVFPITHMIDFPMAWTVIDEERGWVLLEYCNIMADPGDGTVLKARSYTRLKYAGHGQWRFEEDIYSPLRMRAMLDAWLLLNRRFGDGSGMGPRNPAPPAVT